jgi:acyl-coenzyme A thioesterase PaaI-like protein
VSQGFLSRIAFGANGMRRLFNLWPPFRGAGIRVREIAPDFSRCTVELRMGLLNRNYVGTHFGGSLFSMTDPFFMILMMKRLGPEYLVWDKAGTVRFLKPARGTVTARFELPEQQVDEARQRTQGGAKYEPVFRVEIVDSAGVTVADVEKTLYIRKKNGSQALEAHGGR